MNIRVKHFAIKLLIKHGTDGLHNMILKKDNFYDFQCYCSRLIKVLDMFEPFAIKSDIKTHLLFIQKTGFTATELLELHSKLENRNKT